MRTVCSPGGAPHGLILPVKRQKTQPGPFYHRKTQSKPIRFGFIELLPLMAFAGLAGGVALVETIREKKRRKKAAAEISELKKATGTQDQIAAITQYLKDGQYETVAKAIPQIRDLPVSDTEKTRLVLMALRTGAPANYQLAQKEAHHLIADPRTRDPIKEQLSGLLAEAPTLYLYEISSRSQSLEKTAYTDKYIVQEAQIKSLCDHLDGKSVKRPF